jgi:hypothetical protein
MKLAQLATAVLASNVYGVYNSTELPTLQGMVGTALSPYQTEIHLEQFNGNPEYNRLNLPESFAAFMEQADTDGIAGRSFSVNQANYNVRLSESEPESLTMIDSFKVHNMRSLESAVRQAILKYSRLADYISVDYHQGRALIQVYRSGTFGSGVVGL